MVMTFNDTQIKEIAWWARVANYEGAADNTPLMRDIIERAERIEEREWEAKE